MKANKTHDQNTTLDATDAVDVVDGPIGSAWLKDPATSVLDQPEHDGFPAIDLPDAGVPLEGIDDAGDHPDEPRSAGQM